MTFISIWALIGLIIVVHGHDKTEAMRCELYDKWRERLPWMKDGRLKLMVDASIVFSIFLFIAIYPFIILNMLLGSRET